MVNRKELQRLSSIRRREAKALLAKGRYEGAYYLMGYAVECALKSCIAAQIKRSEFPDKKFAHRVYTHKLGDLLTASGLKQQMLNAFKADPALQANWATVKDWKESARYRLDITAKDAIDLHAACTSTKGGVLRWIKQRW